jgi:uncharacterized protein
MSPQRASFRFFAELNDFLGPTRCQQESPFEFDVRVSVKDAIESLGVPHPEVALLLVNGQPVDFSYALQDGDRVSVYPVFHLLDVQSISRVRWSPSLPVRFVLDTHLGRLAAYLRMAGFDTLYRNAFSDDQLAEVSSRESRVLLTRDINLLKRSIVRGGYWIREIQPRRQLAEVLNRFQLSSAVTPFSRCLRCNAQLEVVAKRDVLDGLRPRTREHFQEFRRCPACRRVYWKGSHYGWMRRLLDDVLHGRDDL